MLVSPASQRTASRVEPRFLARRKTCTETEAVKVKGLRWWMISLVMLGTIANYLSRFSFSVAAPSFMKDLHVTTEQYGYAVSAFQFAYAGTQMFTGYLLDVIGLKVGLAIFAIAWSLVNMSHGLAGSWNALLAGRAGMGVTESCMISAGMKTVSNWFPARERGIAAGIFNIGTSLGAMIAPPLIVWAILRYDWRYAFYLSGAVGLAWALIWCFFYNDPQHNRFVTPDELALLREDAAREAPAERKASFRIILNSRNFWAMALARFLADPAWATMTFFLPLFMVKVHHLDMKQMAMLAWLPFLAADFGAIAGGVIGRLAMRWFKVDVIDSKRIAVTVGALIMPCMSTIGFLASPYLVAAAFCVGGFCHQLISTTVISLSTDLFSRNEVGTATGMAGTVGGVGSTAFLLLMGGLVTSVGYTPFFFVLGLFDLGGMLILWLLLKKTDRSGRY
ncbi:MFS transporter [Robbsia andropogonis]|uniref:MFS transporter n=1 Tax=Robbsia andropogonis TaxID=28092 RepID=UPI0009DCFFE0|nr:MFS transporter [Robbsia andropogonis]MCP1118023.1 MFS transporter [Robbsia andropogonis]MCP1127696.1 MFS transporter [Robbsia andropogonis]